MIYNSIKEVKAMSEQTENTELYTTGEIAKLCGVSVRTVQYYDTRSILIPSKLSEGGRRLYTEDDLKRMKIICFLRELDIPINSIGEMFQEAAPENVISILLDQQEELLRKEMQDRQTKLGRLVEIKRHLRTVDNFSVYSIGDVAHIMESKSKLFKMRLQLIIMGLMMECIETGTAIFWWLTGIWWPFAIGMGMVLVLGIVFSKFYYQSVAYICPQCHNVFVPTFKEMFWAAHTVKMRKLTCPHCNRKGYCVETYRKEN